MKTCRTCRHEYLDSYDECPFCAQTAAGAAEEAAAVLPRRRVGSTLMLAGLTALVVMACLAGTVYFAISTNAESDQNAIEFPPESTAQEQCFLIEQAVEQSAAIREARYGDITVDAEELVPEYLSSIPPCPEDGEYELSWHAGLPRSICSVHGWHGGP